MKKTRLHVLLMGALLAAFTLVLALVIGAEAVLAADTDETPAGTGAYTRAEEYTLSVGLASGEYAADLASSGASVKYDVYRVASAEKDPSYDTYAYTMLGTYAGLQADLEALMGGAGTRSWQDLYDAAKKLAVSGDAPVASGTVDLDGTGAALTLDEPGLYLVVVRAADGTYDARSKTYGYWFQSTMVAMPSKLDAAGGLSGLVRTDQSYGAWVCDLAVELKASREKPASPRPPAVFTGDNDGLAPAYAVLAVSGTGLVVLGVAILRRRRG